MSRAAGIVCPYSGCGPALPGDGGIPAGGIATVPGLILARRLRRLMLRFLAVHSAIQNMTGRSRATVAKRAEAA
jgi:hypothetical protein